MVTRVGFRLPDLIGGAVEVGNDVGDVAQLLKRPNRDHVLGRARRRNRVRAAPAAIVVAVAAVLADVAIIARGKHKQHRLRAGHLRQCVAHRRVVTGRRQVIGIVAAIAPTVVGNERIRQRRSFLQVFVCNNIRVGATINAAHRIQCGQRCLAPEIRVGDRAFRHRPHVHRLDALAAVARNDARHVRPMTVGVHHTQRGITDDSNGKVAGGFEIRMIRVNAGIVHFHNHVLAGQAEIISVG